MWHTDELWDNVQQCINSMSFVNFIVFVFNPSTLELQKGSEKGGVITLTHNPWCLSFFVPALFLVVGCQAWCKINSCSHRSDRSPLSNSFILITARKPDNKTICTRQTCSLLTSTSSTHTHAADFSLFFIFCMSLMIIRTWDRNVMENQTDCVMLNILFTDMILTISSEDSPTQRSPGTSV